MTCCRLLPTLLLLLPQGANAWIAPHSRPHRNTQQPLRVATSPSSSSEENGSWSMAQDWALLDNVPRYTVGESSHARTFWAQLGTAVPALNAYNGQELQDRYSILKKRDNSLTSGPPPPLLQDWSMTPPQFLMQGRLEDGRTIWFDVQAVGRLADDPIIDVRDATTGSPVDAAYAGGYVEAKGGRVYELGKPLQQVLVKEEEEYAVAISTANNEDENETMVSIRKKSIATAVASAALSVALLSAAVGYGAGLALRHEASPTLNNPQQTSLIQERVWQEQRAVPMLRERLLEDRATLKGLQRQEAEHLKAASKGDLSNTEKQARLETTEKRARMEARVRREEQVLDQTAEQLLVDSARLQDLQQREGLLR